MKNDFTSYKYKEFLTHLNKIDFPIYTLKDWIEKKPNHGMILRHDVDRNPKNAIVLAKIVSDLGIKGTFNFRVKRGKFETKAIKEISQLGHEIGYHYEDLSFANGKMDQALKLFNKHLALLREIAEVKTATMHGRPLSRFDNREIWEFATIEEFKLIGEAYISLDYKKLYYLTDTGRTWGETTANIRDRATNSLSIPLKIKATDDIREFVYSNNKTSIAIVFHPERWSSNYIQLTFQALLDSLVSAVKKILKYFR